MKLGGFRGFPSAPADTRVAPYKGEDKGENVTTVVKWSGLGLSSRFGMDPELVWGVDYDTWTDPITLAGIYIKWAKPTNMTHLSTYTDNSWMDQAEGATDVAAYVIVSWSQDGVNWTSFVRKGVCVTYYSKPGSHTSIPTYIFFPETRIKARYWKVEIPEGDFVSGWGDNTWHHSSMVIAGTLDGLEGIILDNTKTGRSNEKDFLDEKTWGASLARYVHIGDPIGIITILKTDKDSSNYATFTSWMDPDIIRLRSMRSDSQYETYRSTFAVLTTTGFVVGTGYSGIGRWDPYHDYLYGASIGFEKYTAFGWVDNKDLGIHHMRGATDSKGLLPNPSGILDPRCVIIFDGQSIAYLTHKDLPGLMLSHTYYAPITIGISNTNLLCDAEFNMYDTGVIVQDLDESKLQMGKYTGTGATGLHIQDVPVGFRIKLLFIKEYTAPASGDLVVCAGEEIQKIAGKYVYDVVVDLNKDESGNSANGFAINETDWLINRAGKTYYWWAWS